MPAPTSKFIAARLALFCLPAFALWSSTPLTSTPRFRALINARTTSGEKPVSITAAVATGCATKNGQAEQAGQSISVHRQVRGIHSVPFLIRTGVNRQKRGNENPVRGENLFFAPNGVGQRSNAKASGYGVMACAGAHRRQNYGITENSSFPALNPWEKSFSALPEFSMLCP